MRILFTVFSIAWLLPLAVAAQSTDYKQQYYLFAAPIVVKQPEGQGVSLAIGGGGELLFTQHAAAGFEIAESLVSNSLRDRTTQDLQERAGHVFWVALNGGYQFRRRDSAQPFKPFVTAGCGISGVNYAGVGGHFNYGAGFTRWSSPHRGLRVEVRRFLHSGDADRRFLALRVGLVLR